MFISLDINYPRAYPLTLPLSPEGRGVTGCNPERVDGLLPLPSGERIEVRGKAVYSERGANL